MGTGGKYYGVNSVNHRFSRESADTAVACTALRLAPAKWSTRARYLPVSTQRTAAATGAAEIEANRALTLDTAVHSSSLSADRKKGG